MSDEEIPGEEEDDDVWCNAEMPMGYVCSRPAGHPFDPGAGEPHAGFTSSGMLVVWPKPLGQPGVSVRGSAWRERYQIAQIVDRSMREEETS